jgi:hypothetical protein
MLLTPSSAVKSYNAAMDDVFKIQEERSRDLDYQQAMNEENILEQGNSLTKFTLVKKKNVLGEID